mmetsp:Transcript_37847/g.67855  ORF Transcript_37847/g.67855 Transcript_37847/m.67855 type:complete len:458 (-) Transcript_37847:386-1759(-)
MASAASKGGVVALQRRRSKTAHQGKSLGAVRLKEATETTNSVADEKRVLKDIENNGVAPVKPAPLEVIGGGAAQCDHDDALKPNALSPTTRFQTELASNGTTDKWFDEQLTEVKHTQRTTSGSTASASSTDSKSQLAQRFQRIQDTFKQHFRAAVLNASSEDIEGMDLNALQRISGTPRRSSPGIMDLGLDAINKVGQTCLDIAEAVDTTIEQWLEGFQNLDEVARMLESSPVAEEGGEVQDDADSGSRINIREQEQARWGNDGSAPLSCAVHRGVASTEVVSSPAGGHRNGRRHPPTATPVSKSARKAQEELVAQMSQEVAAREAEFKRMQEECMRLQAELRYAANKCSALSEENSLLRRGGSERGEGGGGRAVEPEPDPITDLMACQLEALLAEKSKLAQDNARLLRENTTLQDMLTIGLGSDDEEEEDEEGGYCYYQETLAWRPPSEGGLQGAR